MTHIANLDACDLNLGDEKVFKDFIDGFLPYTYNRGSLLFFFEVLLCL